MVTLPPLRRDLKQYPAAPNRDGSPAWTVEDPVTNHFFRIGWLEHELLRRWSLADPERVLAAVNRDTPLAASRDELAALLAFLGDNQLLVAATPAASGRLASIHDRASGSRLLWLLHHYLFFRIPLVRPQAFLRAGLPWVEPLFGRAFRWFALVCTLLGLVLVARQWDVFLHTFQDHLSPAGLFGYALALIVAKTLHELGHAFTATRLGLRVGHMGVAFLVMWPMLYTDTGDSWKLSDPRQRFAIAAAGIRTELALAGFATLAWSLADDGAWRSALFFLATTSWLITIAINASPFMRFDGYFLLSDALDLPNLHARSFALARAALRRSVLGWDEPDPEPFSPGLRRGLLVFAWATWIYRLVIFIGIAVAVYLFFFKSLGLLLLVVELVWFVARPIYSELRLWAGGGRRAQRGHVARALMLLLAIVALAAVPWRSGIRAEGWLHSAQQQWLYSPVPARVEAITAAGPVSAGQVLLRLDSPDTQSRAAQSRIAVRSLALQLDQTVGRVDGMEVRGRLAGELAQQQAESSAQGAELQRLSLTAAFGGVLTDIDPLVKPGVWVNPGQPIALLYDPSNWVVDALVAQEAIARIERGARARFHGHGRWRAPLTGVVVAIDSGRAQHLPHPMLATLHGGQIPTVVAGAGIGERVGAFAGDAGAAGVAGVSGAEGLVPRDALYRVRIRLDTVPPPHQAIGQVTIDGESRSLLADWLVGGLALLIRESGF